MNAGSCSAHSDYSRMWVCSMLHILQEKLSTYGATTQSYQLIINTTILIPLIMKNTIFTSLLCFSSDNFPVHFPIRLEARTMLLFPPQQSGGTCIYLLVKYNCTFTWLPGTAPFSEKVDRAVKIGQAGHNSDKHYRNHSKASKTITSMTTYL